nr:glycerophosphodiester phosphodiesterase family protein [uncultured Martelella sp.]
MRRHGLRFPCPSRADGRPLSIAHRGASAHAAENTLEAFRVAAGLGADMWEIDVHLTRDGVAVISHDPTLGHAVGVDVRITKLDLTDLRALAPDMPTLDETIALASKLGQALYVEVKARGAGAVTIRRLMAAGFQSAVLGSFMVDEVRDLVDAACPFPVSVLVPLGMDPFALAAQTGADIIHLCWERGGERPQDLVTQDLMQQAREQDLGIVLWHEERRAVLDELIDMPVLGICTNNPEMMARLDPLRALGVQTVFHRGANRFAPENTVSAGRLAFELGADYLELDVRQSADGALVVIHDATVDRTTNGTGRVADMTLSDLRALDAGSWFSRFHSGEKLPTLREMIALCQSYGRQMYIEIKDADPVNVIALVEEMDFLADCFFWSRDTEILCGVRAASSKARIRSTATDYPTLDILKAHLDPVIVEFHPEDFCQRAAECRALGMTPMLQYFGDDPEIFRQILLLRPPMLNLDRADLLLAACAGGKLAGDSHGNAIRDAG